MWRKINTSLHDGRCRRRWTFDSSQCESDLSRYASSERERVSLDRCSSLRINLWSNNVPLHDGTASFIERGDRPKKFTFHLATMLMTDDRVRLEFDMITMKKKRKKLVDRSETSRSAQFSSFSEDDHDDGGHRHRYVDSKHHRALWVKNEDPEHNFVLANEERQMRLQQKNLELLQKRYIERCETLATLL